MIGECLLSRLRLVLKFIRLWSGGHSSHVNGDIVMLGESGAGRMCLNYAHVGGEWQCHTVGGGGKGGGVRSQRHNIVAGN